MNRFPIAGRELRVAARRPATWWLRLSATLLALAFLATLLAAGSFNPPSGGLHGLRGIGIIMLTLASLSGCFLTADSISAERREGTLGLLFLTPLRALDVVLGKLVVSGLTMTLCLVALLPLLFITMLVGGVTPVQAVNLAITILTALLLSLGVGLLVSALSVDSTRAAMTTLAVMVLVTLLPLLLFEVSRELFGGPMSFNPLAAVSPVFTLVFGLEPRWTGSNVLYFWFCVGSQGSLGVALVAAAAVVLSRNWRLAMDPPVVRPRIDEVASTSPGGAFSRWRNPYEELVYRQVRDPGWARWFRRFVWSVLLAMCACILLLRNPDLDVFLTSAMLAVLTLHLLVGLALALESSRLVHQHLRSGAYELLLATPLPGGMIPFGLTEAFQRRFRRAMLTTALGNVLVLLTVMYRGSDIHMYRDGIMLVAAFLMGGLVTSLVNFGAIPWAGVVHGLRARTPLRGAFRALLLVHGFPWAAFCVVFIILVNGNFRSELFVAAWFLGYYLAATVFGVRLGIALRLNLRRRFRELVTAAC
ncbi:MAG TPA: hypothetical protein DCY13_18430 [Verrucomicrobiales bacterium]|nr:hypothetical protein [Verrucomicrobiales bacterium]